MTNIHKLVTDPALKARLRETSGIGTEATRANMLETLIFREYMKRDSKGILKSTVRGQELIDLCGRLGLPLIDPLLTAFWEDKIADIAAGNLSFDEFMREQIAALSPMVEATKRGDIPLENDTGQHCPKCKASLIQRTFKQSGKPFYACTNPDCGAAFFQNDDGTPGSQLGEKGSGSSPTEGTGPELPCCKAKAVEQTTKNGAKYLRCPKCRAAYWVDKTTGGVGKKWDK
jgi:DNA topoisomerase-3